MLYFLHPGLSYLPGRWKSSDEVEDGYCASARILTHLPAGADDVETQRPKDGDEVRPRQGAEKHTPVCGHCLPLYIPYQGLFILGGRDGILQ
jgi:hypothetical protein